MLTVVEGLGDLANGRDGRGVGEEVVEVVYGVVVD